MKTCYYNVNGNPALDKSAHFKGLVAEQKLDVKNLDLMLAVAELTFLRQFSFRRSFRCFTAGGPTAKS
jgi:hypothetical protein